jgi:integrase
VATSRSTRPPASRSPAKDPALWATAFYAGLRRGELRALRWVDVDLAGGVIDPKSTARRRKVPIAAVLHDYLIEHRLRSSEGLVFGRDGDTPWATGSISQRANKAWKAAKLTPITLHECRHTFASLMIAAAVNPKALQTFMGHSSITVTLDRYGHLFPGSEGEAAVLLDSYLAESHERARSASIDEPRRGEVMGKSGPSRSGLERS